MSLRVGTANTDFLARGDRGYLAHLCGQLDVLMVQEAKDTHLARALPDGWVSLQDEGGRDRMGAAIAVRDEAVAVRGIGFHIGAEPFIKGKRIGMLARWVAVAELVERETGHGFGAVSAHAPPQRFEALQAGFTTRLGKALPKGPVVVGVDANQPIARMAQHLGLKAHGEGIVGLLTRDVAVTDVKVRRWGLRHDTTDHPAVTATVTLPRK